jgi:hypothetical protein
MVKSNSDKETLRFLIMTIGLVGQAFIEMKPIA